MNPRKIFILLITIAALLILYIIYSSFNHVRIVIGPHSNKDDTNVVDINGSMGKIGTTRVGTVVKAVYTDLDQNKNVKREFGFERLLHESGSEWTIQKPYMNIIEKDFVCGITADTGKVQVEIVGGKPTPRDAQLSGNVVIHILPDKGAKISESFAYLDDISYINEKSLFTTAGPVRFESEDVEMKGNGLEVIYNPDQQRLELMHLAQMEYLRLKTYKDSVFAKNEAAPNTKPKNSSAKSNGVSHNKSAAADAKSDQYYRCILSKNVVINYGSQAIMAEEVAISNLFLPKSGRDSSNGNAKAASSSPSAKSPNNVASATSGNSARQFTPVNITCEGSVIVRPMEETASTADAKNTPQQMLEISGTPVVIKTSDSIGSNSDYGVSDKRVLAQCGWLKYNLDLGVLDMFSRGAQQFVSLNLEQDGSKLETSNSLSWSIKDRKAVVRGPGTLYLPAGKSSSRQDFGKAQMDFGGTMNVAFADDLTQSSINIKSVNLAGGFTAAMQNNASHLKADAAVFNFIKGNTISDANLDGNITFNSPSGSLRTQKARLFFADNAISQAALDGNVNFSSTAGSGSSQSARVFFDKGSAISEADLNGNVNFDSGTGSLKSQHAKVIFTKDVKGNVYASSVQSLGSVEIIPAKSKDQTSRGVFHAQKIDYDVVNGYAVAEGPVELTFHGNSANDSNIPATITAKQKAEYFLTSNEVIFTGDVQGKMAGRSNQYDEFNGDKLVAKLSRSNQNARDSNNLQASSIEHLSITGDVVRFESYQKPQDTVVGGIKLKCRKVDYDGLKDAVFATGGKDCFAIIDNSKAPQTAKTGGSFNLKGPCYAKLSDFDNLQWYMKQNRIVAQGIPAGMHISYLPIERGSKYGQKVQVDSSRVQIDLTQLPTGRKEIAALKATGGIHYQEENTYEFFGNELFYDGSTISIAGDSAKPCMVNGVIVDRIAYNLISGNIQTQGLHDSAVPLPPKKLK